MLPNLLIAGAPRCGTTSLFHYLQKHPEISFPNLKEPRYFSSYRLSLPQRGPGDQSVDYKLITRFDDYIKLYERLENTYVGDGSTTYLYQYAESIPEILQRLGQPHIILVLRNPVLRAYSAYYNLVRDGRETENFGTAVELEASRIASNYDMMWHLTSVSMYADSVHAYLQAFASVKVILYDDLSNDPSAVLTEIAAFLGISSFPKIRRAIQYSRGGVPRLKSTSGVIGRKSNKTSRFRLMLEQRIGRYAFEKIGNLLLKPHPEITTYNYNKLLQVFTDDINRLEEIISRDLSHWKKSA